MMTCDAFKMVTEFVTDVAALKFAFPVWLALTLHMPALVAVSVVPAIVHGPDATL